MQAWSKSSPPANQRRVSSRRGKTTESGPARCSNHKSRTSRRRAGVRMDCRRAVTSGFAVGAAGGSDGPRPVAGAAGGAGGAAAMAAVENAIRHLRGGGSGPTGEAAGRRAAARRGRQRRRRLVAVAVAAAEVQPRMDAFMKELEEDLRSCQLNQSISGIYSSKEGSSRVKRVWAEAAI